jgi:hypothetical protein
MPKQTPAQRALAKFDGSPTKMAAALGNGVLRQHVEHWVKSASGRIPTEHVRAVHELTGVKVWEFRPDDWHRIWPDLIGSKGAPPIAPEAKLLPEKRSPDNHPGQRATDKPRAR